ncbi:MAG: hypothetical protein K2L38_06465, partial [Dysosmobacter sp.]|nr:hypothetical protein [Dysosmobacter sp.]
MLVMALLVALEMVFSHLLNVPPGSKFFCHVWSFSPGYTRPKIKTCRPAEIGPGHGWGSSFSRPRWAVCNTFPHQLPGILASFCVT